MLLNVDYPATACRENRINCNYFRVSAVLSNLKPYMPESNYEFDTVIKQERYTARILPSVLLIGFCWCGKLLSANLYRKHPLMTFEDHLFRSEQAQPAPHNVERVLEPARKRRLQN